MVSQKIFLCKHWLFCRPSPALLRCFILGHFGRLPIEQPLCHVIVLVTNNVVDNKLRKNKNDDLDALSVMIDLSNFVRMDYF